MSAVAFTFHCSACGYAFTSPEVPEHSYGEFVLRSTECNYVAYLEALEDPIFADSSRLLRSIALTLTPSIRQQAALQQKLFSVLCDPDPHGHALHIGLRPPCPVCGSRDMACWEPVTPAQVCDLPPVTHVRWDRLSNADKETMLRQAARDAMMGS